MYGWPSGTGCVPITQPAEIPCAPSVSDFRARNGERLREAGRTDNPRHTRSGEYTGGRFRLANWRVRSRLVALILIPTVVGVLLAGVQLANAIATTAEYQRLTQVAELVQRASALSHELAKERTLTAWYMADRRRPIRLSQLKTQREASD